MIYSWIQQMKKIKRSKVFSDIVNRILFVKGINHRGIETEKWVVLSKKLYEQEREMIEKKIQDKKLNKTIQPNEKKLNKTIIIAKLGDLVTHKVHPLGIGLVVEKHKEYSAFRVNWLDQPSLTLFIDEKVLIPINKERTHESDDL
tara:strand:+ start:1905 stop:2339 length:435 start_codon:yes stop_codon:yes gene_type:complete